MKRKLFLGFIVLLVISSVLCFAQTSGSNAQRLVGTWVFEDDDSFTIVLNSNGTGTFGGTTMKYNVTGDEISIVIGLDMLVYKFSISSDGGTLILKMGSFDTGSVYRKRN